MAANLSWADLQQADLHWAALSRVAPHRAALGRADCFLGHFGAIFWPAFVGANSFLLFFRFYF